MNITFDFEDTIFSIEQEFAKIPKSLMAERKVVMNKIARIVKKNVENNLPKSDLDSQASNYDGSTPYIHMRNDVKTSVRDDNQGTIVAVIKGGKYTGYKWHLVNNGTVKSRATHFADKAMKQSEAEFDELVDDMIRKAVQ